MRIPFSSAAARRLGGSGATVLCLLILLVEPGWTCGPGRIGNHRHVRRKLLPLVFKQHVPNVSENTMAASGLREGRINRDHPRFKDLVPNYNSDIIFKDEEGTGADRLMTKLCSERLNVLAISVMNQWPGVRLRVTEGWDEEQHHSSTSLHYEGRAVDITTSDRDRSKYGMLARLAVEAGFHWVYYESRSHIHCSVKSESMGNSRPGGCFPGSSQVETRRGTLPMSEVRIGDEVLAASPDGSLVYSEVVLFLDREETEQRPFVVLSVESGRTLTLTPEHLVYVASKEPEEGLLDRTLFANQVRPGHMILVVTNSSVEWQRVVDVQAVRASGVYAPLTTEGNLVVDGVLVSCYAVLARERWAHWAFFPVRVWENFKDSLLLLLQRTRLLHRPQTISMRKNTQNGVHWYAAFLYDLGQKILPKSFLYLYS